MPSPRTANVGSNSPAVTLAGYCDVRKLATYARWCDVHKLAKQARWCVGKQVGGLVGSVAATTCAGYNSRAQRLACRPARDVVIYAR
jgi:hypothetical protein